MKKNRLSDPIVRQLGRVYLDAGTKTEAEGHAAQHALADRLEELGLEEMAAKVRRKGAGLNAVLEALDVAGADEDVRQVGSWIVRQIQTVGAHISRQRHAGYAQPEGDWDDENFFDPSERERAGTSATTGIGERAARVYDRCYTIQHCTTLAWRAFFGMDVPPDVEDGFKCLDENLVP
jgi:hypothetical protein